MKAEILMTAEANTSLMKLQVCLICQRSISVRKEFIIFSNIMRKSINK